MNHRFVVPYAIEFWALESDTNFGQNWTWPNFSLKHVLISKWVHFRCFQIVYLTAGGGATRCGRNEELPWANFGTSSLVRPIRPMHKSWCEVERSIDYNGVWNCQIWRERERERDFLVFTAEWESKYLQPNWMKNFQSFFRLSCLCRLMVNSLKLFFSNLWHFRGNPDIPLIFCYSFVLDLRILKLIFYTSIFT